MTTNIIKTRFTEDDDGLAQPWAGRLFLNPPYSTELIAEFIGKLAHHVEAGDVEAAVVLTNNATDTAWFSTLVSIASAVVFPIGRIRFWGGKSGSPLQGQAIVYVGDSPERFVEAFSGIGWGAMLCKPSNELREVANRAPDPRKTKTRAWTAPTTSTSWGNAGIGSSAGVVSWKDFEGPAPDEIKTVTLSEIIEPGSHPELALSDYQIDRMRARLIKYGKNDALLDALNRHIETKRPGSDGQSPPVASDVFPPARRAEA